MTAELEPSWLRTLTHGEAGDDVPGAPILGLYPTHAGQEEDLLTDQIVRSGFASQGVVIGSVSFDIVYSSCNSG